MDGTDIELRVTDRCVARCAHCAASASVDAETVLPLETAIRFLDAFIARWGAPRLWCLSGGEPMLYPDRVYELARLGRSRGIESRLSTNGFWAETPDLALEGVRKFREEGIAHVWVSTDSFHAEFVPVRRVATLIDALKTEGLPFYVNLNYLLPADDQIGGMGLPSAEPELELDRQTLRIHREMAAIAGDGGYGWCRVMDLGRGKDLLDSLGRDAGRARQVLRRYRVETERPRFLELTAGGDVIYRCKVVGNVNGEGFPGWLDVLG